MKFHWSYLVFRWTVNPFSNTVELKPVNCSENEKGISSSGFPAIGLRVQVYWEDGWYCAKVIRWSKSHRTWVLKYDCCQDHVYEDVAPIKWKF